MEDILMKLLQKEEEARVRASSPRWVDQKTIPTDIHETFACEYCERAFNCPKNHKTHTKTHHPEKCYKCPRCDKLFTSYIYLKTHILFHQQTPPVKCLFCNYNTTNEKSMNIHTTRMHRENTL